MSPGSAGPASRRLDDAGDRGHLELSRDKLLRAIGTPEDLTLIRPHGNLGDQLILAGTRQLLSGLPCRDYREVGIQRVRECRGHTALLGGSGGWCRSFHGLASQLAAIEERFERVIVLPSSFDTTVDSVRRSLARSRAVVFAREATSFEQIRSLCQAELAHDCAFFFDFGAYSRQGTGVLTAFRSDEESASRAVPPGNIDISVVCSSLDEWLWVISRHELIRTDRAHVTIAGALLGKRVEYAPSSYHKVPAIVQYSLQRFPIVPLPAGWAAELEAGGGPLTDAERVRVLERHIHALVPEGATFLLVDDAKSGSAPAPGRRRLPFLERDGGYWGAPADDAQAIRELERMRARGAAFVLFAWPSFWWLDHYSGFGRYLRSSYGHVFDDDVVVCFDLRVSAAGRAHSIR